MTTILKLAAGIKENNENISRKVQLMSCTIDSRDDLLELRKDEDYVTAIVTYTALLNGLANKATGDMTGLTEHVQKIRAQAIVLADLVVAYFAKSGAVDHELGLARISMFYPHHHPTGGLV